MRPRLTGFSPGSNRRVVGVWVVFLLALASWALGGYIGAAIAVVVGAALVFVRWWGQPAWSWAVLLACGAGARSAGTPRSPWPTTDPVAVCACKTVLRWSRCNCSVKRTKPPR